ncbi:entericidin A/B family lipoprotein [uncultured Caballeronia sp.]|jgi:entericidin A
MKRVATLLVLIGVVHGAAGCNTVHGFGEDVRATGNAISNAAK